MLESIEAVKVCYSLYLPYWRPPPCDIESPIIKKWNEEAGSYEGW